VLQTAQRVGSAVGVAAVTAVFFAGLDGGEWAHALSRGLRLATAFVALGLIMGLVDLRRRPEPADAGAAEDEVAAAQDRV
jgi:hypothetical protein